MAELKTENKVLMQNLLLEEKVVLKPGIIKPTAGKIGLSSVEIKPSGRLLEATHSFSNNIHYFKLSTKEVTVEELISDEGLYKDEREDFAIYVPLFNKLYSANQKIQLLNEDGTSSSLMSPINLYNCAENKNGAVTGTFNEGVTNGIIWFRFVRDKDGNISSENVIQAFMNPVVAIWIDET